VISAGPTFANPGDLDPTFGEGGKVRFGFGLGDDQARAMTAQVDGKILVAGYATNGSHTEFGITRFLSNGSLDLTFGQQGKVLTAIRSSLDAAHRGDDFVYSIRLYGNDRFVVAGTGRALGFGTNNDFVLARYYLDGSLDTSFDGDGRVSTDFFGRIEEGFGMTVQADGNIILVGPVETPAADFDFGIARYNPDGSPDATFGGGDGLVSISIGIFDQARGVTLQEDGKILVSGAAVLLPSTEVTAIVRLNSNGSPDLSFDGDGILTRNVFAEDGFEAGNVVLMQPNLMGQTKFVIAGTGPGGQLFVLRYNLNGTPDNTFDGDGLAFVPGTWADTSIGLAFSTSAGSATAIYVGGHQNVNPDFAPTVAKLTLGGALDLSYNGDGLALAYIKGSGGGGLLLYAGTKVILCGSISVDGQTDTAISRLDSSGDPDPTFGVNAVSSVDLGNTPAVAMAVAHQVDGKIVVAGRVQRGSRSHFAVARLENSGKLDPTFDGDGRVVTTIGDVSDWANAVALQADGKIVAAGTAQLNGPPVLWHFAAARYRNDGSLDPDFSGDGKMTVSVYGISDGRAVGIQDDQKIIMAGSTQFGLDANYALIRMLPDGTPDGLFDGDGRVSTQFGSFADTARAIVIRPGNGPIAVGSTELNEFPEFGAAAYTASGGPDNMFAGDGTQITSIDSQNDAAFAAAIQPPKNRIVAVGESGDGEQEPRFGLARWDNMGGLDPSFGVNGVLSYVVSTGPSGARGVSVLPDGRFLVAGWARPSGSASDFAVVRFLEWGENDETFGAQGSGGQVLVDLRFGGEDRGNAISVDGYQRAVVAGESGGVFGVVRLLGDNGLVDTGERSLPSAVRLALAGPNPFRNSTMFLIDLPKYADITVTAHDVTGSCLRRFADGLREAGRHPFVWDGRLESGSQAASGVYFVRLIVGTTSHVTKVVKIAM
jgi:uncharacterized delta-60 repeat protein